MTNSVYEHCPAARTPAAKQAKTHLHMPAHASVAKTHLHMPARTGVLHAPSKPPYGG